MDQGDQRQGKSGKFSFQLRDHQGKSTFLKNKSGDFMMSQGVKINEFPYIYIFDKSF